MTLLLNISAQLEAMQRAQAAAAGKPAAELAIVAREERLGDEPNAELLPLDDSRNAFDAWVAGQASRNPRFDDSRDSIYPDRR